MSMNVITEDDFIEILKKERGELSLREFAKLLKNKVSIQFLGNVISGAKRPGNKLAKALGYEQIACFRKRQAKTEKDKPKRPRKNTDGKEEETAA